MSELDAATLISPTPYRPTAGPPPRPWHQRYRGRIVGGLVAVLVLAVIGFLVIARSVRLEVEPATATVSIQGGLAFELGGTWIVPRGDYTLVARAPGYEPLVAPFTVTAAGNQSYRFTLTMLPGLIEIASNPQGAEVRVDDASIGITPIAATRVPAGPHEIAILHPRYKPHRQTLDVEGREILQRIEVELVPNWAVVTLDSDPPEAAIFIDDVESGTTPAAIEIVEGSRAVRLKRPGFKSWQTRFDVVAGQDQVLPRARLEPADALLALRTEPAGVGVTVNGRYAGTTPVELSLSPNQEHRIRLARAGFETVVRSVRLATGEERSLAVTLPALIGTVVISTQPTDAEVLVDGAPAAGRRLELPTRPHRIEVRKPGYVAHRSEITPRPGLTQELKVALLTEAEARLAALPPRMQNPVGGEMLLFSGGPVQLGASRREPGRRANEVLRDVTVTRLFYLAAKEVTNREFRQFASGHSSGKFEEHDLDRDDQPVANVSWEDAARFCNWLSKRADLKEFYRFEFGKLVGIDPRATGYRLPTEAEWAWAARTAPGRDGVQRFPWGDDFPPPDRHGNYADRSAAHLVGRVIFGYNDNHIVSAPVGSFAPNARGLYDLSGNVAEWISDFYEIPSPDPVTDPMGPSTGEYHVILGSSWMHSTITDLRGAFRDYGSDGRPDLGFRVARFAE
jgi:formylglycine-generating enzyme required for sulfatase activity